MRNIILTLILLVFIVSCKKNIEKKDRLDNNVNNVVQSEKKVSFDIPLYKDIFNKKLIGLSIKDSSQTKMYERYWLDFYSTCMWNSLSIYIDTSKQKIYFSRYSEDFNLKETDIIYSFEISEVRKEETSINFTLLDDKKTYSISFFKLNKEELYRFKIDSLLKETDMGRHEYYIDKSKEGRFSKEDCGDFEG